MRQNIKITKREMKEDKFTTFMLQAKDYFLENWIFFVGGIAAVIIIIVGITVINSNRSGKQEQAADIFNRAMTEYRSGSHQLAIADFKTIVDDYGSAYCAKDALFNLGNAYFAAGNYTEAKASFENYLAEKPEDLYFITSAMAGIAASMAGGNDLKGAADKYREIAETYPDFKLADKYLYQAMHYYVKGGEMESARVVYAKLAKDFADSQQYLDAARLAAENKITL